MTTTRQSPADEAPAQRRALVLQQAWSSALGRPVALQDNYFDLGGDSMTALRIISLARAEGVSVTARQLFTTPSLAALAGVATDLAPPEPAAQQVTPASVALSPMQRWFFDQGFEEPERWHQAVLLQVAAEDDAGLDAALQAVVDRHDVFGYRYSLVEGSWVQRLEPDACRLTLRRCVAESPWTAERIVESAAAAADPPASLSSGPLAEATIFSSPGEPSFVLFAVHHLIIDIASWHVLLGDLRQALHPTGSGGLQPVSSAGYASWSSWLESGPGVADRPWVEVPHRDPSADDGAVAEPATPPARGTEGEAEVESITLDLPPALAARTREAGGNRFLEAVAVAALARSWAAVTADRTVRIDVENHGRDTPADLDVSGTVGWFTAIRPVVVSDPLTLELPALSAAVQQGLDSGHPHDFGRWSNGGAGRSGRLPAPQAVLNVLGASGSVFGRSAPQAQELLTSVPLPLGYGRGAGNHRAYELEVFADIDPVRVCLSVRHDPGRWTHQSVRRLLDSLATEFAGAFSPEAGARHVPAPRTGTDE
jgi:aryl carrier-like protein